MIVPGWADFTKSGVPGRDGLPDWEPHTREGGAAMPLDTQPELVHHDRDLMNLMMPDYTY